MRRPWDLLTVTSLLAMLFVSLHIADDVVRGYEPGTLKNVNGIAILSVWAAATLLLAGRGWGYVVQLLGALLAAGIPVLHFSGRGVGVSVTASEGGLFFVWTLFALGVTGALSVLLSLQGLWRLRGGRRDLGLPSAQN